MDWCDIMRKKAIITGCAKGSGREIALELARDGYDIIGTYNTSLKEICDLVISTEVRIYIEKTDAHILTFQQFKRFFLLSADTR